jgi:hypothetical protein
LRALGRLTRDNLVLLPNLEDSVRQWNWLCGTADDVVSLLQEVEEKYPGLKHVIMSFAMGTPKAVYMEQLALFAEEVMPAFRGATGH